MPLLHQSVTMKTVVPDLPLHSLCQPHNMCRSQWRAKLGETASVNDEPSRPSQCFGNHVANNACRWFALITSVVPLTIRPLNVIAKILAASLNGLYMLFLAPLFIFNTWAIVITFELTWMDTKVTSHSTPLVRLIRWKISFYIVIKICHCIDYFHVCIVEMIHVRNNNESQLEELLGWAKRKWIWDLGSITPYGLSQGDGLYCQNKRYRNR